MKIWVIGWNVFREAVRDKILFNILLFALLLILFSGVLSLLTVGERAKIIIDVGLAAMSIFGAMIAIFLGISLVSKEIDRRTIYNILSKPVSRKAFLLGKYLGLAITLLANTLIMTVVFVAVFALMDEPLPTPLFLSIGMIYLETLVIVAVSLFFSTFTTSTLSAIFSVSVYVLGHLSPLLLQMTREAEGAIRGIGWAIYHLLPNFENFDYKKYAYLPMPDGMLGASLGYGAMYIAFVLSMAILVFQRREFK